MGKRGFESHNPSNWNAARRQKMETHNCWTCCYFDHCDPRKKCKLERKKNEDDHGN